MARVGERGGTSRCRSCQAIVSTPLGPPMATGRHYRWIVGSTPPLRFGVFPSPAAADYAQTLRLVGLAEQLGLDLVGVQDHPYQRRFLDTFTLLTSLLSHTERITVFPDVANLPLRGAVMIAKAAASLNVMFPGRFQLGLGAGSFWDAVAALGGRRLDPGEAVDAFEEAVGVMRKLWSGDRGLRSEGDHYRLEGAHSGPVPVSEIEIWSGAGGPRMLDLTGRLCDGWVASSPFVPPGDLGERHRLIDGGAAAAGRQPDRIRRIYNIVGRITSGPASGFLHGDQGHWVETLAELDTEGRMDSFVLMLEDEPESQIRAFAEVADALR